MPFYPSNIYPNLAGVGFSRSGILTTNHPGSNYINNLTSYQELKDTVVGIGYSFNGVGVLTANDLAGAGTSFFSAAKYPTDTNIGTEIITNRTRTITDFATAVSNLSTVLSAYTTAIASCDSNETKIAASFTGNAYFNLQSKFEKITFELNRMNADITLLGAEAATDSLKSVSARKYPSSFNRFTNTAGGI